MFLLPGSHKGGAHGAGQLAASAHAVAHLYGAGIVGIQGKIQVRRQGLGAVFGAVTQIFPHWRTVNNFARVHDALWVEGALQVPEGLIDFGTEHLFGPNAADNSIAMFAAH